jgi:TolB protein
MSADGSNVRRLTYEGDYNAAPAWSPRGNWIAYVCRTAQRLYKICILSPDGQKRVQVTTGPGSMTRRPGLPTAGISRSVRPVDGKSHIYMVDTDGKGLERITFGGTHNSSPSWSPAL